MNKLLMQKVEIGKKVRVVMRDAKVYIGILVGLTDSNDFSVGEIQIVGKKEGSADLDVDITIPKFSKNGDSTIESFEVIS